MQSCQATACQELRNVRTHVSQSVVHLVFFDVKLDLRSISARLLAGSPWVASLSRSLAKARTIFDQFCLSSQNSLPC